MRRKKPLKSSGPINRKPPKKKDWLRPDGSPKRGYTKAGKKSETSQTAKADRLAREDCHSRGHCEAAFWEKRNPAKANGGQCGGYLSWCHIMSRVHHEIRWDPQNCLCMCAQCHDYFGREPHEFYQMVETLKPGTMAYLYQERRVVSPTELSIIKQEWISYYEKKKGARDA